MLLYSALKRLRIRSIHNINLLPRLEEVEGWDTADRFALHELGRLGGGVAYDLEEDGGRVLVGEGLELGSDHL